VETLQLATLIAVGVVLALVLIVLIRTFRLRQPDLGAKLRDELRLAREDQTVSARSLREEVTASSRAAQDTVMVQLRESRDAMHQSLAEIGTSQQTHLTAVERRLIELTESTAQQQEQLRDRLAAHMLQLQEGNEKKLEEMRATVDEKLHDSLEKRLGESFTLVSERLEAVQRGLGEMTSLATGVGDLKRALTNVKVRGVWGEYQLHNIL
jgi:DNA recombination protein RmuC